VRARDPQGPRGRRPLPAHCLLRGRLDERIGADGEPYHTGFELRLPPPATAACCTRVAVATTVC
jgi:hypothetical protein